MRLPRFSYSMNVIRLHQLCMMVLEKIIHIKHLRSSHDYSRFVSDELANVQMKMEKIEINTQLTQD